MKWLNHVLFSIQFRGKKGRFGTSLEFRTWTGIVSVLVLIAVWFVASCSIPIFDTARQIVEDGVAVSKLSVERKASEKILQVQDKLIKEQEREYERIGKLEEELDGLRRRLKTCKTSCGSIRRSIKSKKKYLDALKRHATMYAEASADGAPGA